MRELVRRDFLKASGQALGRLSPPRRRRRGPSCRFPRRPADRTVTRRTPGAALRDAGRRPGPASADLRDEARGGGEGRLRARVVGPRPERLRARARLPGAAEGAGPPGPGRRLRPLARWRLRDRQEGVRRGPRYLQPVPYAKALTDAGYVALCIDHWCFGERSHTTELDTFKAMLWQGQVLWGMMVYDSIRAPRLAADARRGGRRAGRAPSACRWAARWRSGWAPSTSGSGDRGHLLPHRVPRAPRRQGPSPPRHLLLRARPPEGVHRGEINALIAPRAAPRARGDAGQADASRRARHHRPRAEGGLRGKRGTRNGGSSSATTWAHQETAEGRQDMLAFLRAHL